MLYNQYAPMAATVQHRLAGWRLAAAAGVMVVL